MILLASYEFKGVVASLYRLPAAPVVGGGVFVFLDLLLQPHYLLLVDQTLGKRRIIVQEQDPDEEHSYNKERYVGAPLKPIGGLS